MRSIGKPSASAASWLSPTMRMRRPTRVARKHQSMRDGRGDAKEEQRADLQRVSAALDVGPEPERDAGQQRRAGLHVGLAEKERDAGAGQHDGDAHRDVVHPRERADRAVQSAQQHAGEAAASTPSQGIAGFV